MLLQEKIIKCKS